MACKAGNGRRQSENTKTTDMNKLTKYILLFNRFIDITALLFTGRIIGTYLRGQPMNQLDIIIALLCLAYSNYVKKP